MLPIWTIDFESFWSRLYSLSKMSPLEYVKGKEFQLISCSVKLNDYPTDVLFGEKEIRHAFSKIDWSKAGMCAHNMSGFDAYIVAYYLGIRPRMWFCTAAMARPIHGKTTGVSLAKLVQHYAPELAAMGIKPRKDNTILLNTQGKRLEDFTQAELKDMAVYNKDDTEQCRGLFKILSKHYSPSELWQIDAITRMRTEPQFELDAPLLETAASIERDRKLKSLLDLAKMLRSEVEMPEVNWSDSDAVAEAVRSELASAPKFSALLESLGVEVPMKPSPTNPEKEVPALSKTDEAFVALQEHPNDLVAAAARARLDVKSTLLETRIGKFLTAGSLAGGRLPIPIRYCGADTTGRDSGEECNPQNQPRIDPDKPKTSDCLRKSQRAPKGKVVIVADQSGIELRVNHFLWKVPSSMALYQASPDKADLYRAFAAQGLYRIEPAEVTKAQRQIGKLCLAEGTLVLTDAGEVPIEQVTARHKVWDGVEWVTTLGATYKGVKDVITYDGVTATPDHEVWISDGRKVPLGAAAAQSQRLARTGAGRTPLGFGGVGVTGSAPRQGVQARPGTMYELRDDQASQLPEPAQGRDKRLPELLSEVRSPGVAATTSGGGAATLHEPQRCGVREVRKPGDRVPVSDGGPSRRVGDAELGLECGQGAGSQGQRRSLRAGQPEMGDPQAERRQPDALEISGVPQVQAGPPGGSVRRHNPAHPAVEGPDTGADRPEVGPAVVQAQRRVWDLLNCGPRSRFTANGRLVSNCQLGLGFGSGAQTFRRIAKTMGGVDMPVESDDPDVLDCVTVVNSWRSAYAPIVQGWATCGKSLFDVRAGLENAIDPWGLTHTCPEGIVLPSGRIIRYPDLRLMSEGEWPDGRPKKQWMYAHGRHKAFLTGPKVDENIVQALARDSVFDCSVDFYKSTGLRPALRVHDELVYVVDEAPAADLLAELQRIMRTPPKWWPELVVWSEGDMAGTYGDAK